MNNKGNASILILLILVAAIIAASAFAFYTLKNQGALPGYSSSNNQTYIYPSPTPDATVSPDDDINVIETELNSTSEGSVDQDFIDLESSASSL